MSIRPTAILIPLVLLVLFSDLVQGWDLTILHTNDQHAHVEEMNKYGGRCAPEDSADGKCFGGYARHYTAVKKIRQEETNVVLVSGGDWSSGTLWYTTFLGRVNALMMERLGYDAAAVGNHEFDRGMAAFVNNFLKNVTFGVLSANADTSHEPSIHPYIKSHVEITVNGKRIGIIGYTTSEMDDLSISHGNIIFSDEVAAVAKVAKTLKDKGIDIIIAVGHAGFETDKRIAREVPDVDVVVGGHSNTFLYNGKPASIETPEGPYPHVEQQASGRQVLVVQDFHFGKYLGNLKVTFNNDGEVASWSGNPVLLNSSFAKDPDIVRELKPFKEQLEVTRSDVIGQSYTSMVVYETTKSLCRERECTLGNFVADAMFNLGVRQWRHTAGWSDVNGAVWNAGSIRANLDKGNITLDEVLNIAPFSNLMEAIEIKGTTVKKMFEHSVSRVSENEGRFLQVAGFRLLYDISRPVGERLLSAEVLCRKCQEPKLEPVRDDKVYRIMVSSYISSGGDGYKMLKEEQVSNIPLGFLDADIIVDHIRENSPIYPLPEGRIFMESPFSQHDATASAPETTATGLVPFLLSVCLVYAATY